MGSNNPNHPQALETAYTRVLAEELRPQGVAANCCCPGWCATDMSSWRGPKSAADGADTPVWLALLPPPPAGDGSSGGGGGGAGSGGEMVTGGFWRDRERQEF